ncbi:MAG: hypothetical protein AB7L91_13290 [Dehalococcoidia bacterium]
MSAVSGVATRQSTTVVVRGAVVGAVAGMAMAMVAMTWSAAIGMGFWMPLRMIASLPLGRMPEDIGLAAAIPLGLVTHMMVSMMLGVALAALIEVVPAARGSLYGTLSLAMAYGAVIWLVNFYVLAPAAGRDWFTDADRPLQFVSHTFAFGAMAGLLLALTGGARRR